MDVVKWVIVAFLQKQCFAEYSFPQWCQISGNWAPFDPSTSICFWCNESTTIISKGEAEAKVCCNDGAHRHVIDRTLCQDWPPITPGLACENGNKYLNHEHCDGYNNCRDGSDEKACEIDCQSTYRCSKSNRTQCFNLDKVCDGAKDCLKGEDETNCLYYNGSCDGFRCAPFYQCVSSRQICDGTKDCVAGTDEQGCDLGGGREDLFFCVGNDTASETTTMANVCNGTPDCSNGVDETNCLIWTPWSLWSSCSCEAESTQQRNRTCQNIRKLENPGGCGDGNISETQTCECSTTSIPLTPTSTATTTVLALEWIIVITVSTCVLILATIGMIYGAWHNKKTKEAMEKQMQIVANMHTHRFHTLSPSVNVTTPEPSTASYYIPSPNRSLHSAALMQNEPLPATPLDVINLAYESMEDIHNATIDPYAETRFESHSDEEHVITVVETYQTVPILSNDGGDDLTLTTRDTMLQQTDGDDYLLPLSTQPEDKQQLISVTRRRRAVSNSTQPAHFEDKRAITMRRAKSANDIRPSIVIKRK